MGKISKIRDTVDGEVLVSNDQQKKQKQKNKTQKTSIENVQPIIRNDDKMKMHDKLNSKKVTDQKAETENVAVKRRKVGEIADDSQSIDMKHVATKKTKYEVAVGKSDKRKQLKEKKPPLVSNPSSDMETETVSFEKTADEKSDKKKKKREKVVKQTDEESAEESQTADSTAKYHALEYLRRWKHSRSEWSFQKVRQVWLLKNMYDESKVVDTDFDILVEYLEDLAGKARQSTIEYAEKKMKECDEAADGEFSLCLESSC